MHHSRVRVILKVVLVQGGTDNAVGKTRRQRPHPQPPGMGLPRELQRSHPPLPPRTISGRTSARLWLAAGARHGACP